MAYFEWSRFFLLFAVSISILIPVLPVPDIFKPAEKGLRLAYTDAHILQYAVNEKTDLSAYFSYIIKALFVIWLSGVIIYGSSFVKSILNISRLKRKSAKKPEGDFNIYKSEESNIPAFSFFKNIFTGKKFVKLNASEQAKILAHEKQHGRLLHTADRILFELYRVLFWFNPFSKTLLNSLKEVHEFSADQSVTRNRFNEDYSMLLVRLASKNLLYPAGPQFSASEQLKHRLQLIADPEPNNIRKRRFWVSLPVLALTMFALWFSLSNINAVIIEQNNKPGAAPIAKNAFRAKLPYFQNTNAQDVFTDEKIFEGEDITVSHRQIDYKTKSRAKIFAVGNGRVISADTNDFQGLPEITLQIDLDKGPTCIYENLAEISAFENERVTKGQLIGFTGDSSLYPIFTFKMMHKGIFMNPEKYFNY
jgi:beta-lactamase regulating signal transducer with metallopeptidase domain